MRMRKIGVDHNTPPPHLCVSMPRGSTSPHPCRYHNRVRKPERSMGYRCVGSPPSSGLSNKPSKGSHPHSPDGSPQCRRAIQLLHQCRHCWPRAPPLRRRHTPSPPRLGNATSRIALAAAAAIAIATATVATTTKVPHSDGCCPRDGDVVLHRTPSLHRPACQCSLSRRTRCCRHYRHPHHHHHCGHHRGTAPRQTQPCDSDIAPPEVLEA